MKGKKSVGLRLKFIRENFLQMSQSKFGKLFGVKQGAVSLWEKGERDIPSEVYETLASKFGVNINWLLTGEGEPFVTPQGEGVKKKTKLPIKI